MKRLNWILLAVVVALPFAARAEVVEQPYHSILRSAWDNSLTVNPIDLFTGNLNIEYERALGTRVGLYGGINFLVMRGVLLRDTPNRFAIGPEAGVRIYLFGRAPGGIWIGPYVNAAYVRESNIGSTDLSRDNLALGAGGMAGINLLFGQFNLSLGAGAGYQDYGVLTTTQRLASSYGVTPRLRLALGAVF